MVLGENGGKFMFLCYVVLLIKYGGKMKKFLDSKNLEIWLFIRFIWNNFCRVFLEKKKRN